MSDNSYGIGDYGYDPLLFGESGARWASEEEILQSESLGMMSNDGSIRRGCGTPICCTRLDQGRIITYQDKSDKHSVIWGATGSKKTRMFGMPMIHSFALCGESFIAADPKGELCQRTSGFVARQSFNTVVLDFRRPERSAYWNPLDIPHRLYHSGDHEQAIAMLTDFIYILAEPQRKATRDPYFIELAYSFTLAYLLFFIDSASHEQANMWNFSNFFATHSSIEDAEEVSQCLADGSLASIHLQGVLSNKEAKGTYGNVAAAVSVMLSPFILRKSLSQVLSKSSFDLRKIGQEKTAIYIIVPDENTTLHFLVAAFVKQVYSVLISEAQRYKTNQLPMRLNFLLDEFCNIPTIPDMPAMISAARSRNIRFFLMIQSMNQLKNKYHESAHTIIGNCEIYAFLFSREIELLEEISKLCGEIQFSDSNGGVRYSPLITVDALQRLSKEKGEVLFLYGRNRPFVSVLPDIDDYAFPAYPPAVRKNTQLPKIVPYDANAIVEEVKQEKRPLFFSMETYGRRIFYMRRKKPGIDIESLDW